jgi:hypothetical protein
VTPLLPSSEKCEHAYSVHVATAAGQLRGDVVVMAYLCPLSVSGVEAGTPLPERQLVAARRVTKGANGRVELGVALDIHAMQLTTLDGERRVRAGSYSVAFSSGVASKEVVVPLQLSPEAASACLMSDPGDARARE